jgi:hypothetical protein
VKVVKLIIRSGICKYLSYISHNIFVKNRIAKPKAKACASKILNQFNIRGVIVFLRIKYQIHFLVYIQCKYITYKEDNGRMPEMLKIAVTCCSI